MSFYSNHYPEVVAECHNRVAEEEYGWPAEPSYDLDAVRYEPTPADWADYEAWLDSLPAGPEPEPEDLGEPCGSQFDDEPPAAA
jgi:hypothetical protein